jgi:hypothetical protein
MARGSMQSTTTNSVRWTIADLTIFEGDRANRYEIIDGELFVPRAPDWKHQAIAKQKRAVVGVAISQNAVASRQQTWLD